MTDIATSTGMVSAYVCSLILKQVEDSRLVVWFDPSHHYESLVASLDIPDTTVACFKGSFFALRREIDRHLNAEVPPRLVVYVPCAEEDTEDALIELTVAGVVLKPGQHPWQRNTRLSVVAKAALRGSLGEGQLGDIEKQVERGQLALADLDLLGKSASGPVGVLSRIFGTASPQEIALSLLSGSQYDALVRERGAEGELAKVLGDAFGLTAAQSDGLGAMRDQLATLTLCTEFLAAFGDNPPSQLASLRVAPSESTRHECVRLVRTWRSRRDLQESYASQAERVEREAGIAGVVLDPEQIASVETFLCLEQVLQVALETALTQTKPLSVHDAQQHHSLIERRLADFWCTGTDRHPEVRQRWLLIQTIFDLLTIADAVESGLKTLVGGPEAIVRAYADGDSPWCLLDTYQRRLERQSHLFDFGSGQQTLEAAIARARQRYMQIGGELAERFTRQYSSARFILPGILRQTEIFDRRLQPMLGMAKTAYVLVDALRLEMGRELANRLQSAYEVSFEPAAASAPTLTPVGMASLMPGASESVEVIPGKSSKLGIKIGGMNLFDRKGRMTWLRQHASERQVSVAIATLEDLLPQPNKALQPTLRSADLIVVTSQEIDELPEGDNIRLAHIAMDNVLLDLGRLVNKLRDLGCRRIIVTADHGYLFADEMDTDMKIGPPGGQTADLGRRVWVGRGGAASDSYLRAPLASLGMQSDLDIAVPWGFGVFTAPGGARAYFHGGLSPQELIVPVISLTSGHAPVPTVAPAIEWELELGSRKISSQYFSVTVKGGTTELLGVEPPRVHLEIRADGSVISTAVSSSYGFNEQTREVQLRADSNDNHKVEPNTIMLKVDALPSHRVATISLLDAGTGRELARIYDVKISMMAY